MKERLYKLVDVKSISTLLLIFGYVVIAVVISISQMRLLESYDTTLGIALGFYFCNQVNKTPKKGDGN